MSAAGSQPEQILRPGATLGQYEIEEYLASGGMGDVYRARHSDLRSHHAIKVIRKEFATDRQFASRFRREARIMAALEHPNIVRVTDSGDQDELYYFVMEYVRGPGGKSQTLLDEPRAAAGENLEERVREVALQICDALAYAHDFGDEGIAHLDLKPSNIMIDEPSSVRQKKLHIKVTDFGLAQIMGSETALLSMAQTHETKAVGPGLVAGTPPYMSPEQWKGEGEAGHESDIYSLGRLLHEMLTGKLPHHWPPRPSRSGCSKDWDRIIERCTQEEPRDRYPSADALAEDIRKIRIRGRDIRVPWKPVVMVVASAIVVAFVGHAVSKWWPRHLVKPPDVEKVACRIDVQPDGAKLVIARKGKIIESVENMPAEGREFRLAPGSHNLTAQKAGYQSINREIKVSRKDTAFSLELELLTGRVQISAMPGANVRAISESGRVRDLGTSDAAGNLDVELPVGMWTFILDQRDYQSITNHVDVSADRLVALTERFIVGLPGRLELVSDIQWNVWSRGERIGDTGSVLDLPAGKNALTLRSKGYRPILLPVTIPPNGRSVVKVPEPVRVSGVVRLLAEPAGGSAVPIARFPRKAQMRLDSAGWVDVDLPHLEEVVVGRSLQVELRISGYQDLPARKITIAEGRTNAVTFQFSPKPGHVRIISNVADSRVYRKDREVGRTGAALALAPFVEHTLEVRAPGYASRSVRITIDAAGGTEADKHIELTALAGTLTVSVELAQTYGDQRELLTEGSVQIDDDAPKKVKLPYTVDVQAAHEHAVRVSVPGFRTAGPKNETVHAGENENLVFRLEPEPSKIRFACNVASAEIYRNNERIGAAGERLELMPFVKHMIEVRATGYAASRFPISLPKPGIVYKDRAVTLKNVATVLVVKGEMSPATSAPFQARVWIDGEHRGIVDLPYRVNDLDEGRHHVRIAAPGYKIPPAQNVTLAAAGESDVTFRLDKEGVITTVGPRKPTIVFVVEPKNAQIYVNGTKLFSKSRTVRFQPLSPTKIEIKANNHSSFRKTYLRRSGSIETQEVHLKPTRF